MTNHPSITPDAAAAIPLWPQGAPGSSSQSPGDVPAITPFFPSPEKATGAAILICPGGGYTFLAAHEGEGYARFFAENGIAAFVVTYRLGSNGHHYPAPYQDVSRALRYLRAHAGDWAIDPHRIAIIGSSAGGHLASTLLTHFDSGAPDATDLIERESSRPDLGILCYPVISMGEKGHRGSRENLLGTDPSPELIKLLSNELQVTKETPPCFIFHTANDPVVPVENSLEFAAALRRVGVPFDLHIYENGPHGIGLGGSPLNPDPAKLHPWTRDCIFWLKERGFVK